MFLKNRKNWYWLLLDIVLFILASILLGKSAPSILNLMLKYQKVFSQLEVLSKNITGCKAMCWWKVKVINSAQELKRMP